MKKKKKIVFRINVEIYGVVSWEKKSNDHFYG